MNTLKDRLTAALAELAERNPSGSKADMARECGVTDSAVSFWFNGKTKALRGKNLFNAAKYLGVEPSWLNEGRDVKPVRPSDREDDMSKFVIIPCLSFPAGALERSHLIGSQAFRRDMLEENGLDPEFLRVYALGGESMSPNIKNGDIVLVDTSTKTPLNDEVWIIVGPDSNYVRIKRVLIRERNDWVLRSDNVDRSLYEDEIIPAHLVGDIQMLGKVVWRGGWLIRP